MQDVMRFYGLEVNRAGFAVCPFHTDNDPSLKVYDDHYHCFGCGAHGDVTDFTARLFELSQYDAAKKLNSDFGLNLIEQEGCCHIH
jgi:DNA primase